MWLGNRVRFSMLIIASRLICYIYLSSLILNFSLLMVAKTPESEAGFMWPPKPQYAASLFVLLSSVTTHTAIWSLTYHLHNLQSTKGKKICCQRWPYLWLQTSLVQTRLLWLQLNQCAGFMWPPKQPQYAASLSVPLYSVLSRRRRPSDRRRRRRCRRRTSTSPRIYRSLFKSNL